MDGNLEGLDLSILDQLTIPDYKPTNVKKVVEKDDTIPEVPEFHQDVQDLENDDVEEDFDNPNQIDDEEEEETDDDVQNIGTESDDDESSEGDDSPIKAWAEFAAERGLIELNEGEEVGDSDEFLVNKFNERIQKVHEAYKENLPDVIKQLLDAHEQGIPLEELMESESRIYEYSQIDKDKLSENVEMQKQLVSAYLKSQGFDDDEIATKVEKYEDNLLLEDESGSALKRLIKLEQKEKETMIAQAKQANEQQMNAYKARVEDFKKTVMDKTEIIAGIPVTKEQKEKIIKMTTQPVSTLKDGTPVTALKKMELEDPDFLTKLAYVAGVLNWDFSTVEKKAETKVTRKVKGKVNTYKNSPLGKLDLSTIRKAVKISKQSLFK